MTRKKATTELPGLGIYPVAAIDLVNLVTDRRSSREKDEALRGALIGTLEYLLERGGDLSHEEDPNTLEITRTEDGPGLELWGIADDLLRIYRDRLPEIEEDHAHLLRHGRSERKAKTFAAEIRHQTEYVIASAMVLGFLAADTGLREHIANLRSGEERREQARHLNDEYRSDPVRDRKLAQRAADLKKSGERAFIKALMRQLRDEGAPMLRSTLRDAIDRGKKLLDT